MYKHIVYIGLGTNIGDKSNNLKSAREQIELKIGKIEAASTEYITKAWGILDQPDFLNQALKVSTTRYPLNLIQKLLEIEEAMGRKRVAKWGSRLIDLDILFFEDWIFSTPGLIIPHPFADKRRFVLEPLSEISPDFKHPVLNESISNLLLKLLPEL